MNKWSLYLLETGFPKIIPGFRQDVPAASFPFWGNYYFLDFAQANFFSHSPLNYRIIADNRHRSLISFITSRGEPDASCLTFIENGIPQFIQHLRNDPSDKIVLSTLSTISIIEQDALGLLIEDQNMSLVKLSLSGIPVDIYISGRTYLIEVLESYLHRNLNKIYLSEMLFEEILHAAFDIIEDIPGKVLFQNNLMQLYRENQKLISDVGSADYIKALNHLKCIKTPNKEISIENSGFIKDSYIASGVIVEGSVEGSLIFCDCIIRKGASVINSIVMNCNRIGSNSSIFNCLIFPYLGDNSRNTNNIGEKVTIGKKRSLTVNDDYPKQIREGLTVLGHSAEIPGGSIIEAGCFIGPDVPVQNIKRHKLLKRGSTILWNSIR